ncbi:hypothetical protein PIB30_099405, partial [Stylosanthes scabra]|nr:hypothetical protein [Stylosanthes scabra]
VGWGGGVATRRGLTRLGVEGGDAGKGSVWFANALAWDVTLRRWLAEWKDVGGKVSVWLGIGGGWLSGA